MFSPYVIPALRFATAGMTTKNGAGLLPRRLEFQR